MSLVGQTPLFIDTGAFYARVDADDINHSAATALFDAIRSGDVPFGPMFTSQSVVSELATLVLYRIGHDDAVRVLNAIRTAGSINVLPIGQATFGRAAEEFERFDDQTISFVDHTSSVLAEEREIDNIFGFDTDFRTLGFTLVPEDIDVPIA